MRTQPTNWATLLSGDHVTETRVDIAGYSYYGYDGEKGIWSLTTENSLFDKPSIGNCCAGRIDLTLVNPGDMLYTWNRFEAVRVKSTRDSFFASETRRRYTLYNKLLYQSDEISVGGDSVTVGGAELHRTIQEGYRYALTIPGHSSFVGPGVIVPDAVTLGEYTFYSELVLDTEGEYVAIGDASGTVTSTNSEEYPADGAQGEYWYTYSGSAVLIPRMAEMEVYVRLTNGTLTTDWVRKGVYYIDTRQWDAQHEFLTITGYDAMLKAEQAYYTPPVTITGWPKTDSAVVSEVATRIGVSLDSRNVIDKGYPIQLPAVDSTGEASFTLREILSSISALYGGNFVITEDNALRLVPLNVSGAPIDIGTDLIDLSTSPIFPGISKVVFDLGNDTYVEGGTDDGFSVTAQIKSIDAQTAATAASDALEALEDYAYQPLEISTATNADPLWELGDPILVTDYASQIASATISFGNIYTIDIAARADEELDHEYPFTSSTQRETERQIAQTRATLRVDIDAVEASVTGLTEEVGHTARLAADGFTITDADGNTVKIRTGNIEAGAITSDSIAASGINADKLNLTGAITFGDLDAGAQGRIEDAEEAAQDASDQVGAWTYAGTTFIDGTKIKTGTVTASQIQGGTISILDGNGIERGTITPRPNTAGNVAMEINANSGMRLLSVGPVYLQSNGNGGPFLNVSNDGITMDNGYLVIGNTMWGNTLPASGVYGQLFFLRA